MTNCKHWDRQANTYEEEVFNAYASDVKGRLVRQIRRYGSKQALVCDFGCGIGRGISVLARHFGAVLAVDYSSQCLEQARAVCTGLDNVRLARVDLASCQKSFCRPTLVSR